MTVKKRKIEAFTQPRGGFKKMFSAENKALIRTLCAEKHVSIRCIAQMVHVSRNAVRRQIREEGKAREARSVAGAFLKEHAIDVQELYLACEKRCPPLRRRLKKDYQQDNLLIA